MKKYLFALALGFISSIVMASEKVDSLEQLTSILTNELHYKMPPIGEKHSGNEVYASVSVNDIEGEEAVILFIDSKIQATATEGYRGGTIGNNIMSLSNLEIIGGPANLKKIAGTLVNSIKPAYQKTLRKLLSMEKGEYLSWNAVHYTAYNIEAELSADEIYILSVKMPGESKYRVFTINLSYGHN